jgi:hypothetical protein
MAMFRSLLGKTALERQLRFIIGLVLLVSIAGSYWWFAGQSESLIRETVRRQARALVDAVLLRHHFIQAERQSESRTFTGHWSNAFKGTDYATTFLRPKTSDDGAAQDEFEWRILERFSHAPSLLPGTSTTVEYEDRFVWGKNEYQYYQPIRAKQTCIQCHLPLGSLGGEPLTKLSEGDLMAVVKITMPDAAMEHQINAWSAC